MEKDILSLRNIYRFLTVNDYPIYSTGVFKEENRKGLTLTKFWQENLLYEFRSGYYGKLIWRTSGGRNRHTSEMCNRSEVLKWYLQYTSELVSAINEKILLQQINQFKICFQERKYDANVLEKKIEAAITMFFTQDICFGEEVAEFFRKNLADGKEYLNKDIEARLFFSGWMLTFLSLHAMAGEEMNSASMRNFRQNREYSLKALWEHSKEGSTREKEEVHFLTGQNNALCITPLPMMHFFGREMELFDLREVLEQGGYYLLSGMGGIGKTELLRQLLHICVEQGLVDEIAVIQYEDNLKNSCMNAFPNLHLVDGENTLNEAMARIRIQEGKRVLTLVDNMNNTLEEDQDLAQLLTLPGTVLLTSRLKELEGFVTYEVKAPARETGTLIFRDNYGKALSKDDKEQLYELLEQTVWCHTLTLCLLGNTAKVKGWTVGQLKEKLEEKGASLFKTRENREISITQMYHRLYDLSELNESQIRFLRCFAALPYQNYTEEFMSNFLVGCFTDKEDMEMQLKKLQEYGWINVAKQGYSMHPVITECIISDPLKEDDVLPFLNALGKHWQECGATETDGFEAWFMYSFGAVKEDFYHALMLLHITNRIQKDWSQEFVRLLVLAAILGLVNRTSLLDEIVKNLKYRRDIVSELLQFWIEVLLIFKDYLNYKECFEQQNVEKNFPKWLTQIYKHVLVESMIEASKYKEAEVVLTGLKAEELTSIMKVLIEFDFGLLYSYKTQMREARRRYKEAVVLAERYQIPNGAWMQLLYQAKCETEMLTGDVEEATKTLVQLERLVEEKESIIGCHLIAMSKSNLYRCMGKYEEAYQWQKRLLDLWDGLLIRMVEKAIAYGDLALILSKMGRYDEAEGYFQKCVEGLNATGGINAQLLRSFNNMGDMYINWSKPQKAIEALEHAMEYGKDVNGIGAAEVHRNFARAYRLAGDVEKEYENLKQAVPLLEEAYGSDHERTVAMRERLAEVEKLIK